VQRSELGAAELHRLEQDCLELVNDKFYNLEWREAELDAVFPHPSSWSVRQPDKLRQLHLRHCCPPIDSALWRNPRDPAWHKLPLACLHHTLSGANAATAECDRRRKLLGVERPAPHAAAEAAYGGGIVRLTWVADPTAWRDWTLLHIHRRVFGLPTPTLTCTRDQHCSCAAVVNAPPLKLTPRILDSRVNTGVVPSAQEQCRALLARADKLEAQGVPIDRAHRQQMRESLDAPRLGAQPLDTSPPATTPLDATPLDAAPLDASPHGTSPLHSPPFDAPPLDVSPLSTPPSFDEPQLDSPQLNPSSAAVAAIQSINATCLAAVQSARRGEPPVRVRCQITPIMASLLFQRYPPLRIKYSKDVPGMMTSDQFWIAYFRSRAHLAADGGTAEPW
jgi:hypothetical protein